MYWLYLSGYILGDCIYWDHILVIDWYTDHFEIIIIGCKLHIWQFTVQFSDGTEMAYLTFKCMSTSQI